MFHSGSDCFLSAHPCPFPFVLALQSWFFTWWLCHITCVVLKSWVLESAFPLECFMVLSLAAFFFLVSERCLILEFGIKEIKIQAFQYTGLSQYQWDSHYRYLNTLCHDADGKACVAWSQVEPIVLLRILVVWFLNSVGLSQVFTPPMLMCLKLETFILF